MSINKRIAKRSIVGSRVSALNKETGYFYPGVIIGCKNNEDLLHGMNFTLNSTNNGIINTSNSTIINPNTKFVVKFESNGEIREFTENELVGPGFKSMNKLKLRSGQKIWITYNGREVNGTVVYHQVAKDEVLINIQPQQLNGGGGAGALGASSNSTNSTPVEIPTDVTKKLDEVRLLESRKSARLLDQDFDFARLADVAERKRNGSNSSGNSNSSSSTIVSTNNNNNNNINNSGSINSSSSSGPIMMTTTASIDVPRTNISRKRRPSSGLLFQPNAAANGIMQQQQMGEGDGTDECAAAMVLMSLSCSPHSPHWDNGMISSSWSSSSSSGASSWLSGASFGSSSSTGSGISGSMPSSGIAIGGGGGSSSNSSHSNHSHRSSNSPAGGEIFHLSNYSPTPSSSDDGIESDNGGASYGSSVGIGNNAVGGGGSGSVKSGSEDFLLNWDEPRKKRTKVIFKCTWPGCTMIKETCFEIEAHVRYAHLGPKTDGFGDHEEEFYYTEVETPVSVLNTINSNNSNQLFTSDFQFSSSCSSSSPLGLSFAFSPTLSHMDMVRPPSEDPEYKLSQLHHNNIQRKSPIIASGNTHHYNSSSNATTKKRLSPKASPVRRPRGDTKKCRKVYGMDHRELWCTQCKWKKACTRFSD